MGRNRSRRTKPSDSLDRNSLDLVFELERQYVFDIDSKRALRLTCKRLKHLVNATLESARLPHEENLLDLYERGWIQTVRRLDLSEDPIYSDTLRWMCLFPPPSLVHLTIMVSVTLGQGQALPPAFQQLTTLRELEVHFLHCPGKWPASLFTLTGLVALTLRSPIPPDVPDAVGQLRNLTKLVIGNKSSTGCDPLEEDYAELSESLGNLTRLEELELWFPYVDQVPVSIGWLHNLTHLCLNIIKMNRPYPDALYDLPALQHFSSSRRNLSGSILRLSSVTSLDVLNQDGDPNGEDEDDEDDEDLVANLLDADLFVHIVGSLPKLRNLKYRGPCLELPDHPRYFTALTELDMCPVERSLATSNLGQLSSSLRVLRADVTEFRPSLEDFFPKSLAALSALTHVSLYFGDLGVPSEIDLEVLTQLPCLTSLELLFNDVKKVSDSIGTLTALERLSFCSTSADPLPDEISRLTNLLELDLSQNINLTRIPDVLVDLTALTLLNLCDCEILQSLPWSLGTLQRLRSLNLSRCKGLRWFPLPITKLTSLTSLKLDGCDSLQTRPCVHYEDGTYRLSFDFAINSEQQHLRMIS